MNDLVSFWRRMPLKEGFFIHPEDKDFLEKGFSSFLPEEERPLSYEDFIKSKRFGRSYNSFDLSLVPSPYGGDLEQAKVFVLMLNPGFSALDLYAERKCQDWKEIRLNGLRQENLHEDFPNFALDPKYCWTGAFQWWEPKLRSVATVLADQKFNGSYFDALKELSQKVAVIEMVPYHSPSFGAGKIIDHLPSAKKARKYVTSVLLPRALDDDITIVVTRQVNRWTKDWGNLDSENIVLYNSGMARGASLTENSTGGKALLARVLSD